MAENGRYRAVKEKYALRQRSGIYTRHTRGFIEKPVAIYYLYMQMQSDNIEIEQELYTDEYTEGQKDMSAYKARNGFTLQDADTGRGWEIKTAEDVLTALLIFPAFQTISSYYIWDAIDQATTDRKEYADIREFAEYLLTNYI